MATTDLLYRAGLAVLAAFFVAAVVISAVAGKGTDVAAFAGLGVVTISGIVAGRRLIESKIARADRR